MKYRVYIETYDHELINALNRLDRKKGKYLFMAFECYYYSKEGRRAFNDMISEQFTSTNDIEKEVVEKKKEKRKKDAFNIDDFLSS